MGAVDSHGASAPLGRLFDNGGLRSIMSVFSPGQDREASDLIAALNDVASAVSSALAVEDVLNTIVDSAKKVTDTEKALLVLSEEDGHGLDMESLVVRGALAEHPQYQWESLLYQVAATAISSREVVLELDRENHQLMMCAPIMIKERPVGVLAAINSEHRRFTPAQVRFLAILSAFASSSIENARLAEEHRYVMLAGERDRIAREMHDGVVQSLFSISLGLEVCKKQVFRDPTAVSVRLEELQQHLTSSMSELRRLVYDLRPKSLSEFGLAGSIERWVEQATMGRGIETRVVCEGEAVVLPASTEGCLFRVAKEAVSNAARHANATRIEVGLYSRDDGVRLTITDDGCGFDFDHMLETGGGIGLRSIHERVVAEGGTLSVKSEPGAGTCITVEV